MIRKLLKWGGAMFRLLILKIIYRERLIIKNLNYKTHPPYIGKRVSVVIEKNSTLIIYSGVIISDDCQIAVMDGALATIKQNVYLGKGSRIFVRKNFLCGEYTLMADNVSIYDHNHVFKNYDIPISLQGFSSSAVSIGKNCWLCTNVVVTKGSEIEDNVVVGANSVINGYCKKGTVYTTQNTIKKV